MLYKTAHFHQSFMNDLIQIVFTSHEKFRNQLADLKSKDPALYVGFRKDPKTRRTTRPFTGLIFVGSYPDKQENDLITDIDISQVVTFDNKLIQKMQVLFYNLDRSNFMFLRLYCGQVEQLQPPWNYDSKGDCSFNLDKAEKWVRNLKPFLDQREKEMQSNKPVYPLIQTIFNKDSLSLQDLLNVERLLEPYMSIVWTKEDILRGYKVLLGKKYQLLDVLNTKTKRLKVLKFVYKYRNPRTNIVNYCPIDIALKDYADEQKDKEISDFVGYNAFYNDDIKKMLQTLKRYVVFDKFIEYNQAIKNVTKPYSNIMARFKLIDKLKSFSTLSNSEIKKLEDDVDSYIKENNITPTTLPEMKKIVEDRALKLLEDVQQIIRPEYQVKVMTLFLRAQESKEQIPKSIIRKRIELGNPCPFFPIDSNDLIKLYSLSKRSFLDPKKMVTCLYQACSSTGTDPFEQAKTIFSKENYFISKENGKVILKRDEETIASLPESYLNLLQVAVLFGH